MLRDLVVDNFAIIEHLELSFEDGFTVLTGETGAGKSILVEALNLLLGGRASTDIIRTDEDTAVVEASFEPEPAFMDQVNGKLEARGIDTDDHLMVRRIVRREGRNKVFVNGRLTTVRALRDITEDLVDISGQHEHYSLIKANNHLQILDAYAELEGLRQDYRQLFENYKQYRQRLDEIRENERDRENRIDFLEFQLNEIDEAGLKEGEQEELEEEYDQLKNAEKIGDAMGDAVSKLYEGSRSAVEQMEEAVRQLEGIEEWITGLDDKIDRLTEAKISTEEVAYELRNELSDIEVNPHRLDDVVSRLDEIKRLTKKYGPGDVEVVLQRREEIAEELDELKSAGQKTQKLEAKLEEIEPELWDRAIALSKRRREIATDLEERVEDELEELRMGNTTFEVSFERELDAEQLEELTVEDLLPDAEGSALDVLSPNGLDDIEFFISPNVGEPPKSLSAIASGGELSRLMLAIKNVLSERDAVQTYVFDEVDTGIGGQTANAVGEKIKRTATSHQVLCITHLAQIASRADSHFLVEKDVNNDERMESTVFELSEKQRVDEISRMIGEESPGEATKQAAREMLN
jgi:DNA repair protein RecN (Recombination protein N)